MPAWREGREAEAHPARLKLARDGAVMHLLSAMARHAETPSLARLLRALALLLAAAFVLTGGAARAHLTPNSEVSLVIHADRVSADIVVPQADYAVVTGNPVGTEPGAQAAARAYLKGAFLVRAPDGRPWQVRLHRVEFVELAGPPDLHATAVLTPPPGASTRSFAVDWRVLVRDLPGHFALFVLAGDDHGMIGERREVLGSARAGSTLVRVERGAASPAYAFANAVLLGVDHIIGGYDHMLFLLVLSLPAPLIARAGRWRDPRPLRATAGQLAWIVTAFTLGHSLTLVGATLGGWDLPAAPVEAAIALSVLVSALHAIRPLLPGREPLVALGFGLVHGLAFATLLHEAGADTASTALSLLGFNLGVEAVQLGIVALAAPPLLVLSRLPSYALLRIGVAGFAMLASAAWLSQRTLGIGSALVANLERVMAQGLWALTALFVLATARLAWMRLLRDPGARPA